MDSEEKRKELERNILKIMGERLAKGQMTPERAQSIARMLMDKLHPPLTLEQLYKIAPTLDDEFRELGEAIIPIMKEHDDVLKSVVASHAEKLLKSGKIEEAQKVLKDASI
ncbi:MAG TPA: hypothetical protein VG917_00995 [Patescibacteria group bacterium]|nr:hypothetical protein [Patescibacteria group bacterium]